MPSLAELPELTALDRPRLSPATALTGHVVAMLFWRTGCIHSRHALADLAALQRERAEVPFAVLAVHVATIAAERDRDRIRRAVAALPTPVTVLLDDDGRLRRALGVSALPALLLFDADGELCFSGSGEPNRARLGEAVDVLVEVVVAAGRRVPPFAPPSPPPRLALRPTALASDGDRLWVGAAGHGRVYAVEADGRVTASHDGVALPAGIAVYRDRLFVCDQAEHVVRSRERAAAADGDATGWSTVLGTGRRSADRFGGGFGTDQGLCSPAGLLQHEGSLYLAQAGAHQLWQFDPETGAASAWLGSGIRQLRDGGEAAAFAEPVAIAAGDDTLFVADAGNGAVRAVELAHNFALTIAKGLPRPVAVAVYDGRLLVLTADEPALLEMTPAGSTVATWSTADDGLVDPTALALHGDTLWIADAGADCLFAVAPSASPRRLRRVELRDWPPLTPPAAVAGAAVIARPIAAQEYGDLMLRIPLQRPGAAAVADGVRCDVDVVDEAVRVLAADRHAVERAAGGQVAVQLPIVGAGHGVLRVRVTVHAEPRLTLRFLLPVEVAANGALEAELRPGRPMLTP